MELSRYLQRDGILLLAGSTKHDALEELITVLAASSIGVSRDMLGEAVWKRESLMSTGIGHGMAVPHVRLAGVRRLAMAVGVSGEGIADYVSLDEEPVRLVVLIAAPLGDHEGYIRLLAGTVEVLKHPESRQAVVASRDPAAIYDILTGGKG